MFYPQLVSFVHNLPSDEIREESVLIDQGLICSVFNNLPVIQHHNAVAVLNGAETVRDNNPGALQ
jgi:hypothetical protein